MKKTKCIAPYLPIKAVGVGVFDRGDTIDDTEFDPATIDRILLDTNSWKECRRKS